MQKFPCTQCGECCKHISHISQLITFDNGRGVCVNLAGDNSCKIYANRPLICRIDSSYEKYFASICSWEEFLQKNAEACNLMQISAKLPIDYRIELIDISSNINHL